MALTDASGLAFVQGVHAPVTAAGVAPERCAEQCLRKEDPVPASRQAHDASRPIKECLRPIYQ
ncbi:DRG1 [Symbiodinium microadriaticum]|nr:DRG1 [Symbiodinium microadriaticum]